VVKRQRKMTVHGGGWYDQKLTWKRGKVSAGWGRKPHGGLIRGEMGRRKDSREGKKRSPTKKLR